MSALKEPTMEGLLLLEAFDPFTQKRPLVTLLHLDMEKESRHHSSRTTTERPSPDDPATITTGAQHEGLNLSETKTETQATVVAKVTTEAGR